MQASKRRILTEVGRFMNQMVANAAKALVTKGRVGIYQVMPVTEAMQRLIMNGANALDLTIQAKSEGVKDLRESGLLKVKQGLTSLEEVLSTTNA